MRDKRRERARASGDSEIENVVAREAKNTRSRRRDWNKGWTDGGAEGGGWWWDRRKPV